MCFKGNAQSAIYDGWNLLKALQNISLCTKGIDGKIHGFWVQTHVSQHVEPVTGLSSIHYGVPSESVASEREKMDATFTKPSRLIQSPLFYWLRIAPARTDIAVGRDSIRCRKLVANKFHLRVPCRAWRTEHGWATATAVARAETDKWHVLKPTIDGRRENARAATSNQFRRCKAVIEYSIRFHPLCTECISYIRCPRLYINFISSSARSNTVLYLTRGKKCICFFFSPILSRF